MMWHTHGLSPSWAARTRGLGRAGALRECARGNRGLGRVARVGREIEISFIFFSKFVNAYLI